MNIPADLKDGDTCLYRTAGIVGDIISWKECDYANVDHAAKFVHGQLFSSLTKEGICYYPFTMTNLVRVRRPISWNISAFDSWAPTVIGSPYGWIDIKADAGIYDVPMPGVPDAAVIHKNGADCSHTCAMADEIAGCPQFDRMFDKRRVTPFHFMLSIASYEIWKLK